MKGDPRLDAWLAPLAGGVGEDARYDLRHDQVRQEMSKLEAPGGSDVDWALAVRVGGDLLENASKDFLIAAYLSGALLEQEGPSGFATGVALMGGLIERYWDAMFPPVRRPRARGAALQWALDRGTLRLSEVTELDAATLDKLKSNLARLRELANQHLEEHPAAFQPVLDACARITPASSGDLDAEAPNQAEPVSSTATPAVPAPLAEERPEVNASAPDPDASGDSAADAPAPEQPHPLLVPISPERPAGVDARYGDPAHDEVRTAIKQLETPTGEPPDWKGIAAQGTALLKNRSKDLLIATYVAEAWRVLEGLEGLVRGLELLTGLLTRFHADLFPDRSRGDRARGSALAWYVKRLERLSDMPVAARDAPRVDALEQAWQALERAIEEHIDPDHRPALSPVREQVTRLKLTVPAEAAKPAPDPSATPTSAPAPQASAAQARPANVTRPRAPAKPTPRPGAATPPASLEVPPDLTNAQAVNTFLLTARSAILELAQALRAHEPESPRAYRLLRSGAYLRFFELPTVGDNGRTLVQFGTPETRLQAMLAAGQYEELVELCEQEVAKAPLCLDFHYYSWAALDGLGRNDAKAAVFAATQGIASALPGLAALEAADGRPFAGEACSAWLGAHVVGRAAAAGGPGEVALPAAGLLGEDAGVDDELQTAAALVQSGKVAEGIRAFQACIEAQRSGRGRFVARVAMAEAVGRTNPPVAIALYAGLVEEMDAQHLEQWEPGLAARCLAGYHNTLRGAGNADPDMATTATVVYRRLCRLDPVRGLQASE